MEMDDLQAYNISITSQDATMFFGAKSSPSTNIDLGLLTSEHPLKEPPPDADERERTKYETIDRLTYLMECSVDPVVGNETVVVDFAAYLLMETGFQRPLRVMHMWKKFMLSICHEEVDATPDICIVDSKQKRSVLLVVDRRRSGIALGVAKARLIAKAIAAYQYNTDLREKYKLPPPKNQFIPGILMDGATPTFLKIPVTHELASAVKRGEYPSNHTTVFEHNPRAPDGDESIEARENRTHFLRSFHAFKQLVYY